MWKILGSIWMVNANIPSLMILPSFKFKTYLVFAFTTQIDPKRHPKRQATSILPAQGGPGSKIWLRPKADLRI